jgi:hypothetical protein
MKVTKWAGKAAQGTGMRAGAAILAGSLMFTGSANAQVNYFEDFESVSLNAGEGSTPVSWSNTVAGWVVDNSQMGATSVAEYQGGNVLDLTEWVAEAGQGRTSQNTLGGNKALVFDTDQWADTATGNADGTGYNSFWTRNFDLSTSLPGTVSIGFDYEFRAYPTQVMRAEVSFDGGANWTTLLQLDSTTLADSAYASGGALFNAGTDFDPTSNSMDLRFSMTQGGNDWWGAVDNIAVSATAIPEPSTTAVIGLGLMGLVLRRRRYA